MVHGFIDSVLMSEGGHVYHLVRAGSESTVTSGQSTYQVGPQVGQMADLPSRWPERISDPKLHQHPQTYEQLNISQVELIHPSQTE